jgi:predicted anti-sigma-YlaC factor YlaD
MKKISCNIVRDVLPLYLDDVVSDETKEMVEEHLKSCEACKKEAAIMKQDVILPINKNTQLAEAKVLKNLKVKIRRRKIGVGIISAILAVAVIASLLLFLTFSKSYIPYDDTQFEIAELNGSLYGVTAERFSVGVLYITHSCKERWRRKKC